MSRVLVFGDSVAWGAWDRRGGWVERLREFLDKKNVSDSAFYWTVFNLSISGNRSIDVLRRFEFETLQRLSALEGKERMIIFAIGANDAAFLKRKKRNWTRHAEFQTNIRKLINLARKYTTKVVFVGPYPVDERKSIPASWDKNICWLNADIKKYSETIAAVCKEKRVPFIEMFDRMEKWDYKSLLHDGIHLNSKGHVKLYRVVKDFLFEKKMFR